MKIQCDVCEKGQATVICCADEAALCSRCDVEIHAANKLASKHHRVQLDGALSANLPSCDICQDKAAFIFCVEDRALFCQDCDQSVHLPDTLSGNHHRYLATGIRVALGSINKREEADNYDNNNNTNNICTNPSNQTPLLQIPSANTNAHQQQIPPGIPSYAWAVDDLLEFSELDEAAPNKKGALDHEMGGEMDWWSDIGLFGEQLPHESLVPAQVPQLPVSVSQPCNASFPSRPRKRQRIHIPEDDEEFFVVPDLG